MSNPATLLARGHGSLQIRDKNGLDSASGVGALRYVPARNARINRVPNPSFEVSLSGWGAGTLGNTQSRVEGGVFGDHCFRLDGDGVSNPTGHAVLMSVNQVRVEPGESLVWSFYARVGDGLGTRPLHPQKIESNAAGAQVLPTTTIGPSVTLTEQWQRFEFPVTIDHEEAHFLRCRFSVLHQGEPLVFFMDAVQVEEGDQATPYFDGSTGGAWINPLTRQVGTPHESPSVSTAAFFVEDAATNYVLNPRFETTTAWLVGHGTLALDNTRVWIGTNSARFTVGSFASTPYILTLTPLGSVSEGNTYSGSVMAYTKHGGRRLRLQIRFLDSEGVAIGPTLFGPIVVPEPHQWQKVVAEGLIAPEGANHAQFLVRHETSEPSVQEGDVFWYDAAMFMHAQFTTTVGTYLDGSLGAGYSWSGAANNSASVREFARVETTTVDRLSSIEGSAACWFRWDRPLTANQYIWHFGQHTISDWLAITIDTSGRVRFNHRIASDPLSSIVGPTIDTNTWYFLYTEWFENTIRLRLDNGPFFTATRQTPTGNLGLNLLRIGVSSSALHLNGAVGPTKFFDRPLTEREQKSLYERLQPWSWYIFAQVARPSTTHTLGGWQTYDEDNQLHVPIQTEFFDDDTYILSSESPSVADECKVRLSPVDNPRTFEGHIVRYRYGKDAPDGDSLTLIVRLYDSDGTTLIAEQTHANIDNGFTDGEFVLTESQAQAITNYEAGLVLGFRAVTT